MWNCIICGTQLKKTSDGNLFCPNHGYIQENQEWDRLNEKKKEEKNKEKEKKNND